MLIILIKIVGYLKLIQRISATLNYRYQPTERDNIDLSLGYVHGNTLYLSAAVHSNLNFSGSPNIYMVAEKLNQPYLEPYSRLTPDWQKYLTDTIMWQMGNVGFVTHNVIFNGNELQVEMSQSRFKKTIRAIDLAGRILANNSPTNIDKITIINIDMGVETLRATIPREALVDSVANGALSEELVVFTTDNSPGSRSFSYSKRLFVSPLLLVDQTKSSRNTATSRKILFLENRSCSQGNNFN